MKRFGFIFLMVLIPVIAMAEIVGIPFAAEEFDVDILQHPNMLLINNPHSKQLDTYYTFTNAKKNYQIRYTFFKQTEMDYQNIRMAYSVFILPIILNVAGYEEVGMPNDFYDNDVKKEFNGDFGSTISIKNPKSDFCKGYKYIMLNFYYKTNQGIVVQSILFNDVSFLKSKDLLEIFHSFRFHE
jgi:hypothetical protein